MIDLSQFNAFVVRVFQTIHAANDAGLRGDILKAVAGITGAVAARGIDPVADLAALDDLNQIIADLAAAKKMVQQP